MNDFEHLDLGDLVDAYLTSDEPVRAESLLSHLLSDHATETINSYFRKRINTANELSNYRFTRADAEDLASTAAIDLLGAMRRQRETRLEGAIRSFDGYIKAICYGIYADFWRKRFVEYHKLKNRIRYLLSRKDTDLRVTRTGQRTTLCSLDTSPERPAVSTKPEIAEMVKDSVPGYPICDEIILVKEALGFAGGWLPLDDLVEIIAELRGINEIPPSEIVRDDGYLEMAANDGSKEIVHREHIFELGTLWNEICELPRLQKLALLYHLRDSDGRELNCVWFESGVATLPEIATQFEVTEEAMPDLLVRLPLSDKDIATELGIDDELIGDRLRPRDKRVSNLRKVAREYLQRRLDGKQSRKRRIAKW